MIRNLRVGLLVLLGTGLVLLSTNPCFSAPTKEELKMAMDAVETLVKNGGKDAEAMAKKNYIEAVMYMFKPLNKGGIGVGPKGDGIEIKVMNLARKTLPAAQLQAESADLIKMAQQTKVIGEMNTYWGPKTKMAGKDPKEWKKYNDEMKKYADELIEAVKSGKTDEVKKVSNSLNSSCVNCHSVFRDS